MKILYLTKYSRLGASSRLRSYQYFPYLEKQGINVKVSPLFNDNYLEKLYSSKTTIPIILTSYLRRFIVLFTVFKYDMLVIEKELFPYFPAFFEFVLNKLGLKYVVDYDDAIFHNYDLSRNPIMKLLKNKIRHVMRYSATVTAGNNYLADYAISAGASNVRIIPTVIDTGRYTLKEADDKHEGVVIGWVGSPTTLKYLKKIASVLKEVCVKYNAKVHIIGGKSGIGLGSYETVIDWSESTEMTSIMACDIGVMPLDSSPWEKGKCGYKLIQYMGCGLPVLASPVGVNAGIVTNGYNGYLASTDTEWLAALERYISNPRLRRQHGLNGRQLVDEKYSVDVTALKWYEVLGLTSSSSKTTNFK